MLIIIAILMATFFRYTDGAQQALERQSILQTRRIIDSALTLVFASYAVKGRLDELNQVDGANPFVFLKEYSLLPATYRGELEGKVSAGLAPGWYYLSLRGQVAYRPRFLESDRYFTIVLNYEDRNQSGLFEFDEDDFGQLKFVEVGRN